MATDQYLSIIIYICIWAVIASGFGVNGNSQNNTLGSAPQTLSAS